MKRHLYICGILLGVALLGCKDEPQPSLKGSSDFIPVQPSRGYLAGAEQFPNINNAPIPLGDNTQHIQAHKNTSIYREPAEYLVNDYQGFADKVSADMGMAYTPAMQFRADCGGSGIAGRAYLGKGYVCIKTGMNPDETFFTIAHEIAHHDQYEEGIYTREFAGNVPAGEKDADKRATDTLANLGYSNVLYWVKNTNQHSHGSGYEFRQEFAARELGY